MSTGYVGDKYGRQIISGGGSGGGRGSGGALDIQLDVQITEGAAAVQEKAGAYRSERHAEASARLAANRKNWTKANKAMILEIRKRLIDWARSAQKFIKAELPAKGQGAGGRNKGIAKKQVYRKVPTPDWGRNRLYARVKIARQGYIPVNYGTAQRKVTGEKRVSVLNKKQTVRTMYAGANRGRVVATKLIERASEASMRGLDWAGVSEQAMAWVNSHPGWSDANYVTAAAEDDG